MIKAPITKIERITHSQTSLFLKVKIEVEPKRVVQTSPVMFAEVEKMFIIKQPKANAETLIIAIAASPWIFVFFPVLSSKMALMIVIGKTKNILFERFKTAAIEIAPKAT